MAENSPLAPNHGHKAAPAPRNPVPMTAAPAIAMPAVHGMQAPMPGPHYAMGIPYYGAYAGLPGAGHYAAMQPQYGMPLPGAAVNKVAEPDEDDTWLDDPWGEREAAKKKLESEKKLQAIGAGLQRKPKFGVFYEELMKTKNKTEAVKQKRPRKKAKAAVAVVKSNVKGPVVNAKRKAPTKATATEPASEKPKAKADEADEADDASAETAEADTETAGADSADNQKRAKLGNDTNKPLRALKSHQPQPQWSAPHPVYGTGIRMDLHTDPALRMDYFPIRAFPPSYGWTPPPTQSGAAGQENHSILLEAAKATNGPLQALGPAYANGHRR